MSDIFLWGFGWFPEVRSVVNILYCDINCISKYQTLDIFKGLHPLESVDATVRSEAIKETTDCVEL